MYKRQALAASLAPFADHDSHNLAEYPAELRELGAAIAGRSISPDANGEIAIPDRPGIGVDVNTANLSTYQRPVQITIDNQILYQSPSICEKPA